MPDRQRSSLPARWSVVLAVALLAVALRLPGLDRLGLHGDEDISTLAARGIAQTGWPVLPSGHGYWRAPLYHYLIAPLAADGVDWLPRLAGVALAGLTAILLVRFGRRLVGPGAALAGALLFALSLVEISLARQVRMYALFQPAGLLALWALWRFWETGGVRWGLAAVLLLVAGLATHELAVTLALLFVPIALTHARLATRAFCVLAAAAVVALQQTLRRFSQREFYAGLEAAGEPAAVPAGVPAPEPLFRVWVTDQPLAFGEAVLGGAGLATLAIAAAALGAVLALRATGGAPAFRRLASVALFAGALAAAAVYHPGVAACLLVLVLLQREELAGGPRGRAMLAAAAGLVAVAALAWGAAALGRGHELRDVALGLIRRPGSFAELLTWPPAVGVAAGLGLLAALVQAWRGTLAPGVRFLVIAIVWTVVGRGLIADRMQVRYLSDLWPFWELLAGWTVAGIIGWVAARSRDGRLVPAAATGVLLAGLIAGVLPGTAVPHGQRALRGDLSAVGLADHGVDTQVADIRGACAWLSRQLVPGERVVAIDWLTTYCYLGRLDGWIRSSQYGWQTVRVGDALRDTYLGVPVLPDTAALARLAREGPYWVVAAEQETRGLGVVAPEVYAWLAAREPAFVTPDGRARVYRIEARRR